MDRRTQLKKKGGTIKEKSAFNLEIWNPLGINSYLQYGHDIIVQSSSLFKVKPKLYMAMDSFALHYFDEYKVKSYIKNEIRMLWQKLVHEYVKSEKFKNINKLTRNDPTLAKIASLSFLKEIYEFSRYDKDFMFLNLDNKTISKNIEKKIKDAINIISDYVERKVEKVKSIKDRIDEVVKIARSCNCNLTEKEIIENLLHFAGYYRSFNPYDISLLELAESYDTVRRQLRFVTTFFKYFKKFKSQLGSFKANNSSSTIFGIVTGYGKLINIGRIHDLAVTEFAYPTVIRNIRIITQQAVARSYSGNPKLVVYIDKSGSMTENIPSKSGEMVPKISCACGLGLVLYKNFNAKIFLFDTEVHEISDKDIVKVLLTLRASRGTNIDNVLDHIKTLKRDQKIIIITDGICQVSDEIAREVARKYDVTIVLLPPYEEDYEWIKYFKTIKIRYAEELIKVVK